jgi:hypothetical protein
MVQKKKKFLIVFFSILFTILVFLGLFVYEYFRIQPNDVRFSNVTSSSVTVSWNTKKPTSATVLAFEGDTVLPVRILCPTKEKFYDTRDVKEAELIATEKTSERIREDGDYRLTMNEFETEIVVENRGEYYTHHVSVEGLDPDTEYSFMVGDEYLFRRVEDVGGKGIAETTESPETVKSPYPAYGTVKDAKNGNAPIDELEALGDGVVYVNYLDKSTGIKSNVFSSALNREGSWYIDLSLAKDIEGRDFLDTYDTPDENVVLEIAVDGGNVGWWKSRQFSYQISPVPDIVLNIPNSIQDLDVEGSVVPMSLEDVKGESIVALLDVNIMENECKSNSLGWWSLTQKKCICVQNASFSGRKCECDYGYEWSPVDGMCVSIDPTPPLQTRTCVDCTVPCIRDFTPKESSSTGCYTSACTKYYSDGSGNCGTKTEYCCPVTTSKKLADRPCEFKDYCTCVKKYTDGSNSFPKTFSCTEENCGSEIEAEARKRLCKDVLGDNPNPSENLKCSGSYDLYEKLFYNNNCIECTPVEQNGYYIAKWKTLDGINEGGCVAEEPECGFIDGQKLYVGSTLRLQDRCVEPAVPYSYSSGIEIDEDFTPEGPTTDEKWYCKLNGKATTCQVEFIDGGMGGVPAAACEGQKQGEACDGDRPIGPSSNNLVCITTDKVELFGSSSDYKCYTVGYDCVPQGTSKFLFKIGGNGDCVKTSTECIDDYHYEAATTSCQVDPGIGGNDSPGDLSCSTIGELIENERGKVVCSENKSWIIPGYPCSNEEIQNGTWNINGYCVEYTDEERCYLGFGGRVFLREVDGRKEECDSGLWVDYDGNKEINCVEYGPCPWGNVDCATIEGDILRCNGDENGVWLNYEENYAEDFEDAIIVSEVINIPRGHRCDSEVCVCINGYDKNKEIFREQWCRDVRLSWSEGDILYSTRRVCKPAKGEPIQLGFVCTENGHTCQYESDNPAGANWYCNGQPPVANSISLPFYKDPMIALVDLSNSVLAESTGQTSQYLIDSQTGIFTNIPSGSYIFEYEGKIYSFEIGLNNNSMKNSGILLFIDNNDNGLYDESVDLKVSDLASNIEIFSLKQIFEYSLERGLNFVSMPYLISSPDYRTAAGLLKKLNEVYGDAIYSISKFDGGKWKMVGQNVEIYDNNDFQLLPGEGYVIKAKRDVNIKIVGQPVKFDTAEDSAPIYFDTGWNLVGLYGTNVKTYTAKSMIEDINTGELTVDNVTQWDRDKQMYDGLQITDGKEYGFDYPINKLESYFVRIIEGSGKWQPQLGGN